MRSKGFFISFRLGENILLLEGRTDRSPAVDDPSPESKVSSVSGLLADEVDLAPHWGLRSPLLFKFGSDSSDSKFLLDDLNKEIDLGEKNLRLVRCPGLSSPCFGLDGTDPPPLSDDRETDENNFLLVRLPGLFGVSSTWEEDSLLPGWSVLLAPSLIRDVKSFRLRREIDPLGVEGSAAEAEGELFPFGLTLSPLLLLARDVVGAPLYRSNERVVLVLVSYCDCDDTSRSSLLDFRMAACNLKLKYALNSIYHCIVQLVYCAVKVVVLWSTSYSLFIDRTLILIERKFSWNHLQSGFEHCTFTKDQLVLL
jgi:hypothetical protein